jgi:hypothetical protein
MDALAIPKIHIATCESFHVLDIRLGELLSYLIPRDVCSTHIDLLISLCREYAMPELNEPESKLWGQRENSNRDSTGNQIEGILSRDCSSCRSRIFIGTELTYPAPEQRPLPKRLPSPIENSKDCDFEDQLRSSEVQPDLRITNKTFKLLQMTEFQASRISLIYHSFPFSTVYYQSGAVSSGHVLATWENLVSRDGDCK